MDQFIVGLDRVLHVEILSRWLLLLQHCLNQVFENSPAILKAEINLASEGIGFDIDKAHDFMACTLSDVSSLYKGKAHLVNASNDRLKRPFIELVCVVRALLVEHRHSLLVKLLGPALTLLVPFEQDKEI